MPGTDVAYGAAVGGLDVPARFLPPYALATPCLGLTQRLGCTRRGGGSYSSTALDALEASMRVVYMCDTPTPVCPRVGSATSLCTCYAVPGTDVHLALLGTGSSRSIQKPPCSTGSISPIAMPCAVCADVARYRFESVTVAIMVLRLYHLWRWFYLMATWKFTNLEDSFVVMDYSTIERLSESNSRYLAP
eukprot:3485807-Rhodomonas_salina.3